MIRDPAARAVAMARGGERPLVPPPHPALAGAPHLVAHRGGAGLAPENTLVAFRQAVEVWGADMLELDVHASADGHCVVIHDPTVDRTTDGTGAVARLPLAELRRLDAGYRFTPDGGASFPFRGRGVRIPTIEEVLEALPDVRLIVEVKAGAAQRPLFAALRRYGAEQRVIVAAMRLRDRTRFRGYPGPVSASAAACRLFLLLHRLRLSWLWAPRAHVANLPLAWRGRRLVTRRLVRDLHRRGLAVQVWTVDDPAEMHRLLDWGVDGIVTDRPDRLAEVLAERGLRDPPARGGPAAPAGEPWSSVAGGCTRGPVKGGPGPPAGEPA